MLLSFKALMDRVVRNKVLSVPVPDTTYISGIRHDEIDFNHVNSASIDIVLGNTILVEREPCQGESIFLDYRKRDKMHVKRIVLDEDTGYCLAPGEFMLAESREIFNLPSYLSCEYKLKSSMARIGLEHLNAGWCDAGWHGSVLTLEIKNMCRYHSIILRPGDAIGQMVFFEHEQVPHDRSYAARGRYNHDKTVSAIKE